MSEALSYWGTILCNIISLVRFLVIRDILESIQFVEDLVTLLCYLFSLLGNVFKLACDMINVPFKRQNLLNIVLFLLFHLCKLVGGATNFFLNILDRVVQVLVLLSYRLDRRFESLDLQAGVSVVLQDVFLLKFQGSCLLLSPPFLIGELVVLLLEQVVGV